MASLRLLLIVSALSVSCQGLTSSRLYSFGDGWGDQRLPAADEVSTQELELETPFVFYGVPYSSLFVNMNGFISFLTEIPSFFNVQFPLDYPIIAALYSDVDTTAVGTVWFRETSDPTTISRLQSELRAFFAAAADFSPTGVFIATWDGVGGHGVRSNKVNTFQIILATDGRDSYVVLLYADRGLQWLRGKGKNPSLPDALAQAGFISGDGRMSLVRGSGKDQVRNLDKWSNVGEPGVWVFRVGQMDVTGNVFPPDLVVPGMGDGGDASCSVGGLACHSTASCVDYAPGYCCRCPPDTVGNGINCVKKDEPLRVTGKVTGALNGETLGEADLHSYVLTGEGRTYTAVSRLPATQGYDTQVLVPLGTGISWLFARPSVDGVPNGFALTGGLLNRTVTLDFPQTGHSASVQQTFLGLDVFENVEVKTFIAGTLPTIPEGSKIEVLPFSEEYTRVKQGKLRARSSRVFRLKGQELETPFQVETTIDYDECSWTPPGEITETLRLKVADNIFIQYDAPEKIVRFALSSTIGPLAEEDPCIRGREQCGSNSQCVVDGESFRCVCDRGYEHVFDPSVGASVCADKDECATQRHTCAEYATCTNSPGTFKCTCIQGYVGNGFACQPEASCSTANCSPYATCTMEGGVPRCRCPPRFTGDGHYCAPEYGDSGSAAPINEVPVSQECGSENCDIHAECKFSAQENRMRCTCRTGYSGDGQTCQLSADTVSCHIEENCSPYGTCQQHADEVYRCECLPGFTGDGYTCYLDTDFHLVDGSYSSGNLIPVPVDKIPDYVLGEGYDHIPVEFGESQNVPPYPLDHGSDDLRGAEPGPYNPYIGVPSNRGGSDHHYQPHHHGEDRPQHHHSGGDFDEEALRPALPEGGPAAPAPYVPPHPPQDPLQPYEPSEGVPDASDQEPQCSLGTCFCPPGYTFNKFVGKCRLRSLVGYVGSTPSPVGESVAGAPRPYCGAAKCTCPAGYTYSRSRNACEEEVSPPAPVVTNPVPDCEGGRFPCSCPQGYYFRFPENTCEQQTVEDTVGPHSGGEYPPLPPFHPIPFPHYPAYGPLPGEDEAGGLNLPNYEDGGYSFSAGLDAEARPVPECSGYSADCICPPGYYFYHPRHSCEPSVDRAYDYGIKGGGHTGRERPPKKGHGGQLHPRNGGQQQPAYVGYDQPGYQRPLDSGYRHPQEGYGSQPIPGYGSESQPGHEDRPQPRLEGQNRDRGSQPSDLGYPLQLSCDEQDVCHEFATCIYESEIDIHLCRCNPGFVGDGFTCIRQDFSCDQVNICHVKAQCVHDDLEMRSVCTCITGYVGDGLVCTPEDECNSVTDCDINAQCGFDGLTQRYRCSCNSGYTGDGRTCVPAPDAGCNIVSRCHHNADCVFDAVALTHRCLCRPGYEGDGTTCSEIQLNCHVLHNCGQHAHCVELAPRDYRCVCRQGYTGDGYYCQPTQSCQQDPGRCHHQASCQPDPASSLGYSCQCRRGYVGDGYTCVEAPTFESGLLLLNQGVSVLRMPVDASTIGGGYPISVDAFMSAVGADVDCLAGRYYWTDVRTSTIRSCNYDGTQRKPFVLAGIIGSPEDVAVDWISRNVYWTDSGNDEVAASSIDEGLRRTIISGGLVNPRGIAVHPGRGLLFWSDWNREAPKIESSGLDGSDRRVLVDTNIRLPNSLVVDYETSTLCWADAGTNKIECIGVTGRDRRTVIKGPQYPFGLTLHQHHFYYTDWNDGRIHLVNKYTGSEEPSRAAPPGGSGKLYGIVAVPDSCPPVSNACQVGRGGCPEGRLCLPNSSGGRTCACPANPPAEGEAYQGCTDTVL